MKTPVSSGVGSRSDAPRQGSGLGTATQGTGLVAAGAVPLLIGYALDRRWDCVPRWTWVGLGVGCLLTAYEVWKMVRWASDTGPGAGVGRRDRLPEDRDDGRRGSGT